MNRKEDIAEETQHTAKNIKTIVKTTQTHKQSNF